MAVGPTMLSAAPQAAAASAASAASASSGLGQDYTQFLTLLTAQISNQDPLKPMDATQFVSQLAQLTQVEQSVLANNNLQQLQWQINNLSMVSGPNMIGHSVTVESDKIVLEEGGTASSYYELYSTADNVSVEIRDSSGELVRTISDLPGDPGKRLPFEWDGLDDSGKPAASGNYTVSVQATDSSGQRVPSWTFRDATVEEVTFESGILSYKLSGDETVTADALISVR